MPASRRRRFGSAGFLTLQLEAARDFAAATARTSETG